MKSPDIPWLPKPESHDYPAAASYLALLYPPAKVATIVERLRKAPVMEFKSKDIFRAAQLPLLGINNSHVAKDQEKIQAGEKLSPLLLVRDEAHGKVIIADGYHRLCAIYAVNEDAAIRCKIV